MKYYDIALIISPGCTIAAARRILGELDEMGIEYDWDDLEFYEDGMFFCGQVPETTSVKQIESIEGLEIDWDTMYDWDPYEEVEE